MPARAAARLAGQTRTRSSRRSCGPTQRRDSAPGDCARLVGALTSSRPSSGGGKMQRNARQCNRNRQRPGPPPSPTTAQPLTRRAPRPRVAARGCDECNTLQQNAATSDPDVKSAVTRRERALPPEVARGLQEMGKRMHFESLGDHKYSVTIDPPAESAPGKGRRSRADEQTYRKAGTR